MTDREMLVVYIIGIGTKGIPNGHLYAEMGLASLDRHYELISALKASKMVEESNYYLTLTKAGLGILELVAKRVAERLQDKEVPSV